MTAFVKKLETADIELLENFLLDNKTFSKQPFEGDVRNNWKELTSVALNAEYANVIACFDNEKIKAVVSQLFSSNHPFWFMNYFATEKNTISLKNGYGTYLEMCFDHVMKEAENKGYYDFYVSIPEGYASIGPLIHKKSPSWSRYYVLTDRIIPENQFPEYPSHKIVYGKILKKHKVFIRHAVLKQEYRKENLTPIVRY